MEYKGLFKGNYGTIPINVSGKINGMFGRMLRNRREYPLNLFKECKGMFKII